MKTSNVQNPQSGILSPSKSIGMDVTSSIPVDQDEETLKTCATQSRSRRSNWESPVVVCFSPDVRRVKRVYSTEQIDQWVALITEKTQISIEQQECKVGMVSICALWQDDFYTEPIYDIHGQIRSPKRESPIYVAISCAQLSHTILCEPSSLPSGIWWKSFLPLFSNDKIVKAFWDGRIFLSAMLKNILQDRKKQAPENEKQEKAACPVRLYANSLAISLALIVKRHYIDDDATRLKRRIMRLPRSDQFLPEHADPVQKMLLQSQSLLLSGIDAAESTAKHKRQWNRLLQLSEVFLKVDSGVKVDPLPYVPLDVFHLDKSNLQSESSKEPTAESVQKKFQRFMVHCVDCRRSVPTCYTDPVNITIHGNRSEPEPKAKSKSPGNVYAAYRCRVCAEASRPCLSFKNDEKCEDTECINLHMLIYCPAGDLCCDHRTSRCCPFSHPDELRDKYPDACQANKKNDKAKSKEPLPNDDQPAGSGRLDEWWAFPRVYLGMPAWNTESFQQTRSSMDKRARTNSVPSLYKVPCPDHFASGKCSQVTCADENLKKDAPLCPFSHEPMPVYVPVPVPISCEKDKSRQDLAYCTDFTHSGKCDLIGRCDKIHVPPHLLDSPSLSLEEFSIYYQNMLYEFEKLKAENRNELPVK